MNVREPRWRVRSVEGDISVSGTLVNCRSIGTNWRRPVNASIKRARMAKREDGGDPQQRFAHTLQDRSFAYTCVAANATRE